MKVPNGFYSALDDRIHFYQPADNGRLKNLGSNWKQLSSCGCLGDGDLDFDKELHIAFDSNASISTAVVAQLDGNTMKIIKSFYVKTPSKLGDLVQQIADYYRPKLNHDVVVYYDHTLPGSRAPQQKPMRISLSVYSKRTGTLLQWYMSGKHPNMNGNTSISISH